MKVENYIGIENRNFIDVNAKEIFKEENYIRD